MAKKIRQLSTYMNTIKKKLRSYVINIYSKSNLRMEIYKCYTTKLQTLREEKEDEEDRKKILKK